MKNLPYVLPMIPDLPEIKELILVDGQSTDNTVKVALELVPQIKVIFQNGKGKGDALKYAWRNATGDILVTLDADGSINPKEIPSLIEPLLQGYDLTKGSRFLSGGSTVDMPLHRRIGNWIFTIMANMLFGTRYTDLVYGFHAFRRDILENIDIQSGSFAIDTELYLKVKKAGLKVAEVPSSEARRIYGHGNLRSLKDGWRILKIIFRERLYE
jgi:glycosyltransferase involved in cell wall biosynthesis